MVKLIDKIDKWLDRDVIFNFELFELETNNFTLTWMALILLAINMVTFLIKHI